MFAKLERKQELMERIILEAASARIKHAALGVNPPLLVIRDRGNGYVLRRKVEGIHWEEAVEQLQTCAALKSLNASTKLDRLVLATVRKAQDWLKARTSKEEDLLDDFTYFVSWDIDSNQPKLVVDYSGTFLDSIWIA